MPKSELTVKSGPALMELVINDLTVDGGKEVASGVRAEVHCVGVDYETGEEFDSSWNRGQSIEFLLNGLTAGWQEGIPDMRAGGRRELICPPEKAYSPTGVGHFLSGKTLVFAINLLDVK